MATLAFESLREVMPVVGGVQERQEGQTSRRRTLTGQRTGIYKWQQQGGEAPPACRGPEGPSGGCSCARRGGRLPQHLQGRRQLHGELPAGLRQAAALPESPCRDRLAVKARGGESHKA